MREVRSYESHLPPFGLQHMRNDACADHVVFLGAVRLPEHLHVGPFASAHPDL